MSTTLAKPAEMADRKWYVIDAACKPLGRVGCQGCCHACAARTRSLSPPTLLRDHVIIINCEELS